MLDSIEHAWYSILTRGCRLGSRILGSFIIRHDILFCSHLLSPYDIYYNIYDGSSPSSYAGGVEMFETRF